MIHEPKYSPSRMNKLLDDLERYRRRRAFAYGFALGFGSCFLAAITTWWRLK